MSRKGLINQFKKFGFPRGTRTGNADRRATLNLNKELRNMTEPLGHMPWGSSILQIPELDFYVICAKYPDAMAPDAETQRKFWDRFLLSPESEPYRVRTTDRKGVLM